MAAKVVDLPLPVGRLQESALIASAKSLNTVGAAILSKFFIRRDNPENSTQTKRE
jgi:hypothetical protein